MLRLRPALMIILGFTASFAAYPATACPRIGGLLDWNCDGKIKIAAVGDSIVAGVGDSRYHNRGGYVLRLQKALLTATVVNLGVPGSSTFQLLKNYTSEFSSPRATQNKKLLKNADLIIIDAGRNDYWEKQAASLTVRNLMRLGKLFQAHIGNDLDSPPFLAFTYLLPTRRAYQRTFIAEVNDVLAQLSQPSFPVEFHFNDLDESLISWDGLHPSSPGYKEMERMVESFVRVKLQRQIRRLRPDKDKDGVFDFFEMHRFGTDPEEQDTDGDTFSDGDELFVYHTDPLDPHSYPIFPTPTPTTFPTATPEATPTPEASPIPEESPTPSLDITATPTRYVTTTVSPQMTAALPEPSEV